MDKMVLDFEAVAIIDNITAYASSVYFNGLYKINLSNYSAEFVDIFPLENVNAVNLHAFAIYYNEKVYFIPRGGNYISIYDVKHNRIESIKIPVIEQKNKIYRAEYKFVHAHICNNFIWLIPAMYSGILKLDLTNNSLKIIDGWVPDEGFFFRKTYVYEDDLLYIASRSNDVVLKFDFNSEKGEVTRLGNEYSGFVSAVKIDDSIYLAPKTGGTVIEWQYRNSTIKEYADVPQDLSASSVFFTKIYKYVNKLYLVSATANMSLELSLDDGKIKRSDLIHDEQPQLWFMFETEQNMFFKNLNPQNEYRFVISKETNIVSAYKFLTNRYSEQRAQKMIEINQNNGTNIVESAAFGLQDFLMGIGR